MSCHGFSLEALATRAAADVDDFYATRPHQPADPGDILVLSSDGKGIVMRPDALRPATKAAAKASSSKLATRLSKGEKRNRKRMATVGAVYDLAPVPRTATDVLATSDTPTPAPKAANKWLTASVAADTTAVLAAVFDQAQRRDPTHSRTWVALVDGNNHQIDRIHAEAKDRGVTVTVLLDFVHVLEYLWRAAWSFYPEGDPNAETWVHDKALGILNGKASTGRRRDPTKSHPPGPTRRPTSRRRQMRRLPAPQAWLPRLPESTRQRLAHRHRHHRRRLPAHRQRPDGHHRSAVGTQRRRGDPQATSRARQRRLRRLLGTPHRARTTQSPPVPLRQRGHSTRRLTSLQKSRTHVISVLWSREPLIATGSRVGSRSGHPILGVRG